MFADGVRNLETLKYQVYEGPSLYSVDALPQRFGESIPVPSFRKKVREAVWYRIEV